MTVRTATNYGVYTALASRNSYGESEILHYITYETSGRALGRAPRDIAITFNHKPTGETHSHKVRRNQERSNGSKAFWRKGTPQFAQRASTPRPTVEVEVSRCASSATAARSSAPADSMPR